MEVKTNVSEMKSGLILVLLSLSVTVTLVLLLLSLVGLNPNLSFLEKKTVDQDQLASEEAI